jgi:rhodanese-related sulfurtransferase
MSALTDGVPTVDVRTAHDREPGSVLIDVREDDEWAQGHVPGAVHVPMSRISLDDVPEGRPVYCICRSGNRSGRVAEALISAGVDARNVAGGMLAWADAGLPVEA